ncbi:transposable element Tcb2 transposase [Trichonephila clavipes]|nr:transposable element Tcb2 transposase [Trichonephila clavipes]
MSNHRRLRLQYAHEYRAWQADWHQAVFSEESRYNLWNHDGRIRDRCYAGERWLPDCVITELNSGLTPGVMVWGAISHHGRSNLLRIEGNLNIKTVQHMQLFPWPTYSLDMSLIEHVWDLVGRRPAGLKDELLLRIQAIWNSFL